MIQAPRASTDAPNGSDDQVPAGFDHPPTGLELRIATTAAEALSSWIKERNTLDCPLTELTLQSFSAVTWTSGALGAPKPFRMYTMAMTPGFKIKFAVADTIYSVHTNSNASTCVSPQFD